MTIDKLFTARELADYLRIHRTTVYGLDIPHVMVNSERRWRYSDVASYLDARRTPRITPPSDAPRYTPHTTDQEPLAQDE